MPNDHSFMTKFLSRLERQPRSVTITVALLIVVLVGVIDYLTGYEISLSVFYLIAIALATWYVGRRFGWIVSVLSVISWLVGDLAAGAQYTNHFIPIWNVLIALVSYLVIVEVLWNLRALQNLLEAKVLARTAALREEMTKRQELEKEFLAVGERERQRIGHDLHDSLCQHLTGTALAGEVLGEKLAGKALPEEADARRVVALIEEAITLARNLARGLAPVELEAEGLMAAFRELARNTTERFSIDCRFEAPHPVLVHDSTVAAHLFRIAQEAVSNAIKHGHASRVGIGLRVEGGEVVLEIRDDGEGFQESALKTQGMGLHIMRHRAMMIGAALSIQRQDPGTAVTCRLRREEQQEAA